MYIDNTNPTLLNLSNVNNRYNAKGFCVISNAPKEPIKSAQLEQHYKLPNGVLVRMVRVDVKSFIEIDERETLLATGMMEGEFASWWLSHHPNTTNHTPMGIYYYQRVN
jgi:hypothetical protein